MLEFIGSSRSFLPTPQSDILKRIFYIPFSVEKADQRFNFLKELDLDGQTRTFVFRVRPIRSLFLHMFGVAVWCENVEGSQ